MLQPEATLQLGKSKTGWAWHRATTSAHCVRAVTAPGLACKLRRKQSRFLQQPSTRTAPTSEQSPHLLSGAKLEAEPCLHESCLVPVGLRNNSASRQEHTRPF